MSVVVNNSVVSTVEIVRLPNQPDNEAMGVSKFALTQEKVDTVLYMTMKGMHST